MGYSFTLKANGSEYIKIYCEWARRVYRNISVFLSSCAVSVCECTFTARDESLAAVKVKPILSKRISFSHQSKMTQKSFWLMPAMIWSIWSICDIVEDKMQRRHNHLELLNNIWRHLWSTRIAIDTEISWYSGKCEFVQTKFRAADPSIFSKT